MTKKILSVGLPIEANQILERYMAREQIHLIACCDLDEASVILSRDSFRLILLDVSSHNLEHAQGVAARIRQITSSPLVALTSDDAAVVTQEAGADVCVPADMDMQRVFSLIKTQIRRNELLSQYDCVTAYSPVLFRGDLMLDSARRRVTQNDREISLLPREFRLLSYFAHNPGIVLSAEQLGGAIWMSEHNYDRDVAKVVSDLRRKLDDDRAKHAYIETVHGIG